MAHPMAQPACVVPTARPRSAGRIFSPMRTEPTAHSPPNPRPCRPRVMRRWVEEEVGEPAEEGEDGEPNDGDLQDADAAVAVCGEAGKPAAEGGEKERRGAEEAGLTLGDVPEDD